jgi:hypothetical protein
LKEREHTIQELIQNRTIIIVIIIIFIIIMFVKYNSDASSPANP